jgi:hypothetical protein
MVGVSQPFLYRLLDFVSVMLGLLPSSLAVVAVILVGVESQKGTDQDRKNYYDCRSHRIIGISARCTIAMGLRIKKKPGHRHSPCEQPEATHAALKTGKPLGLEQSPIIAARPLPEKIQRITPA